MERRLFYTLVGIENHKNSIYMQLQKTSLYMWKIPNNHEHKKPNCYRGLPRANIKIVRYKNQELEGEILIKGILKRTGGTDKQSENTRRRAWNT